MIYSCAIEMLPIIPKNDASKVLVQMAVNQLRSVSATVEILRIEMDNLVKQLPEYDVGTSSGLKS